MTYLFQLGHSPAIASRELAQVLLARRIKHQKQVLGEDLLLISTKKNLDLESLMNQLGGCVRIAEKIDQVSNVSFALKHIADFLAKNEQTTFSVSWAHRVREIDARSMNQQVKNMLKEHGSAARFVEPRHDLLTPIKIATQEIQEFILVKTSQPETIQIFLTKAVSDFQAWQQRDRQRPDADKFSGMMPPKVARMLINLGLQTPPSPEVKLLDPFCGSGTVVAEAAVIGLSAFGSDISEQALSQTTHNLEWLSNTYKIEPYKTFQADAQDLSLDELGEKMDLIVFEGYLGPPLPEREHIEGIVAELSTLYATVLPNLKSLLKPGGVLVAALPKHPHPASVKMLENLIDSCEKSGYTLSTGPLLYGQPKAFVKRAIYVLKKTD